MKKVKLENRSTVSVHNLRPGGTIMVEVDRKGTIINKQWRRRVKDADAIYVVKENKVVTEKKGGSN